MDGRSNGAANQTERLIEAIAALTRTFDGEPTAGPSNDREINHKLIAELRATRPLELIAGALTGTTHSESRYPDEDGIPLERMADAADRTADAAERIATALERLAAAHGATWREAEQAEERERYERALEARAIDRPA